MPASPCRTRQQSRHHDHVWRTRDQYELPPSSADAPRRAANRLPPLAVNLDTLEPQQLAQVKKQLDEELEHLTSSFAQLHGAQNKFKDCLRCVNSRSAASDGAFHDALPAREADDVCDADACRTTAHSSVLVPLTNSLYVRGELTDSDSVLVDVGTGFLVEKVGIHGRRTLCCAVRR